MPFLKLKCIGFVFFISGIASCQTVSDSIKQEIERRIELEINPGISIGILKPDGNTQFYNFGCYDRHNKKRPDSLTLYEIGSVTKTFTSTLVNHHFRNNLNVSIARFFTENTNPSLKKITVSELLNHTSGLPRLSPVFSPKDWSNPFSDYSDSLLYEELNVLKPVTSGTWGYSNFGYAILGKILELKTNKTHESLMKKIFREAKMSHSYPDKQKIPTTHIAYPTNIGTGNAYWDFAGPSSYAGGLISCTKDLLKYLKYQKATNPLFKKGLLNTAIPTGIVYFGYENLFYHNGWFVLKPEARTEILLHNGGTGGFTSFIAYHKTSGYGVVVLSNSVSLIDDIGLKLIYPGFRLNKPDRTIAFELADAIENGKTKDLIDLYHSLQKQGYPDNILDIYWLERYFYGKQNYRVSNALSDIMVAVLPEDWEVMDIKGQNLECLASYDEAVIAYKKALALNPGNPDLIKKINRCKERSAN